MNIPNDYKIVKILIADSITLQYCLENCLNNAFEIFRQSKILLNAGDACYWFRQDNNVPQVGWVQLPTWIYFEQFVWDGSIEDLKRITGEKEKVIIVITPNMTSNTQEILELAEEKGHFVFSFWEIYQQFK
jgi:hypothetical protein